MKLYRKIHLWQIPGKASCCDPAYLYDLCLYLRMADLYIIFGGRIRIEPVLHVRRAWKRFCRRRNRIFLPDQSDPSADLWILQHTGGMESVPEICQKRTASAACDHGPLLSGDLCRFGGEPCKCQLQSIFILPVLVYR